nr:hypothetical protein GCM10020185_60010 [Pseudomonas brassicacearum subsp. brassicacearum]
MALVEEDLGRAVALEVARHLVVFLKRPGGQSQFSVTLSLQKQGSRFDDLHAWIAENLTRDLGLSSLAAEVGMSERSFVRHYRADTGQTPARAVELIRLETARRLLSDTAVSIKRVAVQCGFGSEETLRRSFFCGPWGGDATGLSRAVRRQPSSRSSNALSVASGASCGMLWPTPASTRRS